MNPASFRLRLPVAIGVLLLMLWGACALEIARSEREELHDGRMAAEFQSQAFAENTLASIKRINELLLDLRANWTGDVDAFSEIVRARQKHIADITLQVAVIDREGSLAYSSLAKITTPVDLRDRVHFRFHAADPGADRLYISDPVKGKVSGKWSIQFTRPIFVDQRFDGVLVISVSPEIFASFHQKLTLGAQGVTSMVKTSGEILARFPGNERYLGQRISGEFLSDQAGQSGSLMRNSQMDGTARIYGYYKLPEYGLVFIVGRAIEDLMAGQVRHQTLAIGFSAAVSVVLLLLGVWLHRSMRAREASDRALDESQFQQRLLSAAIGQTTASVVVTDTEGSILFVNDAFTRITGYARDEAIGQTPRLLKSGLTDPDVFRAMWDAIREGRPWEGEIQNRRKDGSMYWESGTISPVFDDARRITHYISVKEDISDKKLHEAELRAAKQRAEAASVAKSQFLANMSHEIRTPLNGMIGMAYIGQRESGAHPRLGSTFSQILKSGRQLLGVIDDILDFSRIEADKLHVEHTTVVLSEVIDAVLRRMAADFEDKGIALVVRRANDLPVACLGDALRLGQVLGNLLSNGLKFTAAGAVTVDIARLGDELVFAVSDTGIGMTEQQLARIFSPFEQGDASNTRRYGGTGLGLSITRRLVELMGGSIAVRSRPGEGSTFTVHLPYQPAALPLGAVASDALRVARPAIAQDRPVAVPRDRRAGDERPPPSGGQVGALAGLQLLLAEDDPVNRLVIEDYLIEAGASVTSVENGAEAVRTVEAAPRGTFDAVLMDIQMPVMDGHDATRRIRRLAPELPVIGQTAHAFEQEREACFAAGMVAQICKPIDPLELVAVVRRSVAGSQQD